MSTKSETKYSRLQYFFWLISGSEISILKNCPSDYNRHAGIGFTILMTSLFGAFAGGYAGYYFTHSGFGAVVFGIIWGMLIFSIDRTMVVSMKKRPGDTWKTNMGQILARAILAALIAFIISIPLELLVFKDNIDAGLSLYKIDKQKQLASSLDSLYKPAIDSANAAKEGAKADSLQKVSLNDPKDDEFKQLVYRSNNLSGIIGTIYKESSQLSSRANQYLSQSFIINESNVSELDKESETYRQYISFASLARKKRAEATTFINEKNNIDKNINDRRITNKTTFEEKAKIAKSIQEELDSIRRVKETKIDSTRGGFESVLHKIDNSFSVRFDVITFLSNKKDAGGNKEFPSVFFLLWLIRILFFIIEILPTVTKVMTPFGAYDMSLYEEEQNLKEIKLPAAKKILIKEVEVDNTIEIEERKRQQHYRARMEGGLHDSLVDRIMDAQNRIAQKILDDWEQKNGLNR